VKQPLSLLLKSKLLGASLMNMSVKIASVAILFLLSIVLARGLGPAEFGIYAYTLAWAQLVAVVVQWGFPSALMRSMAITGGEDTVRRRREILNSALAVVAMMSAAVFVAGGLWGWLVGSPRGGFAMLAAGLILIPLIAFSASVAGALRGLGILVWAQVPDQIVRPGLSLLAICAMIWLGFSIPAPDVLLLQAAAAAIAGGIGLSMAYRAIGRGDGKNPLRPMYWGKQSFPFLLLAGTQILNYQIGMIVLGHYMPDQDLGYYRVAVQVADGLNMLLYGISITIAPRIAELHGSDDLPKVQRLLVYAHRLGFAVLLIPCLILMVWGPDLLSLVFGPEYVAAAQPLTLLVAGKLAYTLIGFSGLALSMMGRPQMAATFTLLTLIVNISLALLLVPVLGLRGAVIASVVGELTGNLGIALFVLTILRRDISALGIIGRRERTT